MIGIITYKASNLGFFKVPNLEKAKVPNLGCELSLVNGIMCENVAKYGLFE